jgi:MoxR-like ATPase
MAVAREVMVAAPIKEAAVDLVLTTQPGAGESSRHFRYGASPRGLQALVRSARVRALLAGRAHVAREDLAAVALPVLRHRVLLTVDSEVHGVSVDGVLTELVDQWLRRS